MVNYITTTKDLNNFVALFGSLRPSEIINKLADHKVIVSNEMKKIILSSCKPI